MNIWDKRFMELAELVGTWTNCARADKINTRALKHFISY